MDAARETELLQQIAACQEEIAERKEQLEAAHAERRRLNVELQRMLQENELLRQKVDTLARQLFGKKSEQLDPAQLQLLFQEMEAPEPALGKESGPQVPETEPARERKAAAKPRHRTPRVPEHLPVLVEIIEPEPVKIAPQDWRKIGEEVSDRLDYEPARFFRRRTVRPKYVHRSEVDAAPVIGELPPCLQERSLVTPGLLAQIVVSKYCDHLPLYRQESIYWSRHQVWLPRQTMAQWMGLAADWLRLIYDEIGREVFARNYVQIDETPIRYLEPGHGKTKQGYLWSCHRPGADVIFYWETSRAATCLEKIVPVNFRGHVQCDGYAAYDTFARRRPGEITLAGCWAHARRNFFEAKEEAPKGAGLILHLLQGLYRIEGDLRRSRAGPGERRLHRDRYSRPLLARLHFLLDRWQGQHRFLPQSRMGQAITYALNQWEALRLFLEHGQLEIDQNLVENTIRPTALGKKNWLFIGEASAGDRGAILYTIVESCRRRGIDPSAYLRDIFSRLPSATTSQIKDLTPAAWLREQERASQRKAA